MARSSEQVILGTGTLYVAPAGTAFPAGPGTAPAVAWEDIGYSDDGWTFGIDRSFEDIEVAEEFDPIKILPTGREMTLAGVVVQVTVEAIQTALAGGTITTVAGPPAVSKYVPPAADAAPVEKALLLRSDAPTGTGKKRDIQMPRAISVGAIEIPHAKAPARRQLAISFRLIKPTTGDIFTILDEQAA